METLRNTKRVKDVISFIEKLIVPSGVGEGKPFHLLPFQKRFISDVYGPMDRNGRRVVRRAIKSIARKNGKTAEIACLALVHLVGPEAIKNGEIYSAATTQKQASLVFKYASQIVRADPELLQYIKIIDSTKRMVCMLNGSVYCAIAAEAGPAYGLNSSVIIYDELAQTKTRDLYDALDTSMAAREEPLFIVISTQSNDPQHILSTLIDDGLSGHDPTTICHLHAVPDDGKTAQKLINDDSENFDFDEEIFTNQKLWRLANPALGKFRSLSEMKTAAKRARRMSSFESAFKNLYCNMRIDAQSPLIPRMEWLGCKGEMTWQAKESIYLGLDLSARTDLTAMVAITAGDKDAVKAWFWKPEELIRDHENRDRVPYWAWVQEGYIETTPGKAVQYDWVAHRLGKILQEYNVIALAFDRWRIDEFRNAMDRAGLQSYIEKKDKDGKPIIERNSGLRMVSWGQGYKDMADAVDTFEASVLERKLVHDGNPVLTWNVSNAMVISDPAGNRKIAKDKTRFRIDAVVALCMALGAKNRDAIQKPKRSKYEEGGITII